MDTPPIDRNTEIAIGLLKGGLGAVPWLGGLLSEVVGLFIDPLEKRRQQWLLEVATAIGNMQNEIGLVPEKLQGDEQFVSFLYHATQVAIRNHKKEKLRALRGAIESTAKGVIPEDIRFQFLRYVDELSVTHLQVLRRLDLHAGQFARYEKLEQVLALLEKCFQENFDRGHFRAVIKDLEMRSLISAVDLEDLAEFASGQDSIVTESSTTKPLRVTNLGKNFLDFMGKEPESE